MRTKKNIQKYTNNVSIVNLKIFENDYKIEGY